MGEERRNCEASDGRTYFLNITRRIKVVRIVGNKILRIVFYDHISLL